MRERSFEVTPTRRRFWDLDCLTKDVILSAGFDRQELERLAAAGEVDLAAAAAKLPPCAPANALVVTWIHQMCHGETPIAVAVEREMDRRHRGTSHWVARHAHADICRRLGGGELAALEDAEGLLWGIAVDPRPCLRETERFLARRFFLEGTRALVFGARTADLQRQRIEELEEERSGLLARLELMDSSGVQT